jgi:DDE_Tnp_1-associated/Transposase DDE domain
MNLLPKDLRVKKYLQRHLRAPVYHFDQVPDPRAAQGKRWPLQTLLLTTLLGLMAGCKRLREVEDLTQEMGPVGRQYVPARVPDTTLYELLVRLDPAPLRPQLRRQVKTLSRHKAFVPDGLPCGVAAFDGKGMGRLDHDAQGSAQKAHRAHDQSPYWLPRVLRAVLISAAAKPALDQMSIPPDTNEMGVFGDFFGAQVGAYGDLFELVTVDAGMTSKDNADLVHAHQKGYVMALKDNQPELRAEAERLLRPLVDLPPEAETGFERVKGKLVRRRLYRSLEIAGYHGWTHLQQVGLIRQETRDPNDVEGRVTVEDRYFLTNVRKGRLCPGQILLVVRRHWGIENDCFWSLDAEFGEDTHPWATRGQAVEVLGLLRLMAYNLLQLGRKRHLRPRREGRTAELPSWQQLFRWVWQALRLALSPPAGPSPAD